jgi:hypothetical protein
MKDIEAKKTSKQFIGVTPNIKPTDVTTYLDFLAIVVTTRSLKVDWSEFEK